MIKINKVIPKKLWIEQVIYALTVAKFWTIHALTVAPMRINGRITINSLYLPILKKPLVAADWFLKAARQALKNENRALTLRAIESTLRVFPNNPEALRLKDNLFK